MKITGCHWLLSLERRYAIGALYRGFLFKSQQVAILIEPM